MKKWGLLVLAGLIMGGCADSNVPEVSEEKFEVEEESKAEAVTSEVVEEKTEPVDTKLQAQQAYAQAMEGHLAGMADAMQTFAQLNQDAGADPTLMFEDSWIMDISLAIVQLDTAIEGIRSVEPVAGFEESHALTLKAMDEYKYVVENYPVAVDNMDADMLMLCVEAMTQGGLYLNQANEQLGIDLENNL